MERLVWITGLAGAGKTTIGRAIHARLRRDKPNVVFLDGDELRKVVAGAGHGRDERLALARTYGRLCEMLCAQGIEVVCATVSLFHECQLWNRARFPRYFEIYVEVPLPVLFARDPHGLYSRARAGVLADVVGVDIDFDVPARPDLVLRNDGPPETVAALVELACERLAQQEPALP